MGVSNFDRSMDGLRINSGAESDRRTGLLKALLAQIDTVLEAAKGAPDFYPECEITEQMIIASIPPRLVIHGHEAEIDDILETFESVIDGSVANNYTGLIDFMIREKINIFRLNILLSRISAEIDASNAKALEALSESSEGQARHLYSTTEVMNAGRERLPNRFKAGVKSTPQGKSVAARVLGWFSRLSR